jgi:sarcosine oxidase subunit gamma
VAEAVLQRAGALAALYREGVFGAVPQAPGVEIRERRGLTLLALRGRAGDARLEAAAQAALGLALPGRPGTSANAHDRCALCLAPGEWLIAAGAPAAGAAAGAAGALVDVSHGRTVLRLSGSDVRELLAQGCALELDGAAFAPGRCAQTAIARIPVLLHRAGEDAVFDLYCARSYSQSLWQWLTAAAGGFGYRVGTPIA